MFTELLNRRWQAFRRISYGGAMVVAQKWNMYREEGTMAKSVLEFLPGYSSPEEEKLDEIRQNVLSWFGMHPDATKEQVAALRTRVIASLEKQGYKDAEAMYDNVFAH